MNIELTDMVFPFQVIESRKLDRAVTSQQATPSTLLTTTKKVIGVHHRL